MTTPTTTDTETDDISTRLAVVETEVRDISTRLAVVETEVRNTNVQLARMHTEQQAENRAMRAEFQAELRAVNARIDRLTYLILGGIVTLVVGIALLYFRTGAPPA